MLSKSWVQLLYHLPEPARRLSAHIGFLYPVTRSSILEWKNKQTEIIIIKKPVSLFDRFFMERVVLE